MPTFNRLFIHPARPNAADTFVTKDLAANQTFKQGAPGLLSASLVQETGVNPALILGFFMSDADGYEELVDSFGYVKQAVPIALATQVFRGTLHGTFALADVGGTFGLTEGTDNKWYVDKAKTGNTARVRVIGTDYGIVAGDINVPVTFRVLDANVQAAGV